MCIRDRASSIKAQDSRVASLLSDYFSWKLDTFKFGFYIKGYDKHSGELDDLSVESFNKLKDKCEHFKDRADEFLRQNAENLGVRDKRYVKVLKKEAEFCEQGAKFKVQFF